MVTNKDETPREPVLVSVAEDGDPLDPISVTMTEGQPVQPARAGPAAAILQNPLAHMSHDELLADAEKLARERGLQTHTEVLRKGALLAKVNNTPNGFESIAELNDNDKQILRYEVGHRWSAQPMMLYFLCALCAGCAIVQGMDQTVVNGAQEFYYETFKIRSEAMKGLANGAPYASAALIGCWLNAPLNRFFGRRGTIFFSCLFAFGTNIWQAVSPNLVSFLAARFVLGLAVGAKSSTTPVYAAECAPRAIRGALTMMWQMWTAFGIMIGFTSSLAFQNTDFMGDNTQWRWMIGSTAVPPLIVGFLVYLLPESPRWYMDKGNFPKAFASFAKLRSSELLAARDLYLSYKFHEVEQRSTKGHNPIKELFATRRNWRAAQSSWFLMLMQQMCGVNVIAYYSTQIFKDAGFSRSQALLASFGTGVVNWLFALPAIWTIDTFGRRNLLLVTFPLMSLCLFWAAANFFIIDSRTRLATLATSIYLFMAVYSPGLGPVPFTYAAEAFPLQIRPVGMASATAITWAFNFVLSFTWPQMKDAFGPSGAISWYATWNIAGWIFCYFLLPETKALSLEELDIVFSVRNRDHMKHYAQRLGLFFRRMVGGRAEPLAPLYQLDATELDATELGATELGAEVKPRV